MIHLWLLGRLKQSQITTVFLQHDRGHQHDDRGPQHDDRGHQHHDQAVDNDPRAVDRAIDHNRGQHQLSFNVYCCQVNNLDGSSTPCSL